MILESRELQEVLKAQNEYLVAEVRRLEQENAKLKAALKKVGTRVNDRS